MQVTVEVNAGNAAPAGVAVCAHETVAVVTAAPGEQLTPMSGVLAPSAAGAVMVRFAPAVMAKADAPAGTVQANAKLPGAVPADATVTGIVAVPAIKVAVAAIVAVGATPTTTATGQVMVDVSAGNAAPAGVSVWAQLRVAFTGAGPGMQLKPIAGALTPMVAGAAIVRFAPAVIANETELAGIVHANATLAVATPAVATVTAAVPVPPVRVTGVGNGLSVGATGATVAAGQVKPHTRATAALAVSVQVNVAVPAVAARVQPKLTVPAVVT